MRSIFEGTASVIGAAAFVLLTLSLILEFGYFCNIGRQFQAFISISDYLADSVLLIPLIVAVGSWSNWRLLGEGAAQSKFSLADWQSWAFPVTLVIPQTGDNLQNTARLGLRIGVPLVATAFGLGWLNAELDLKKMAAPYAIQLRATAQTISRTVIRNFEKGLLVKNTMDNAIEFLRWADIATIEKAK